VRQAWHFFVISGFLMELLYGGRDFQPKKYWAHRIGRIYPLWLSWRSRSGPVELIPHILPLLPITRVVQIAFAHVTPQQSNVLLLPALLIAYLLVVVGSFVIAAITFRFLEKPVMNFVRRL
jgi:peptidoglycan/LPS O-acetylase OafA/YrhL